MKSINKEDINSYDKGLKLAHEILSLLQAGYQKSDLNDLPQILDWINNNPNSKDLIEKLCNEEEIEKSFKKYNSNNVAQQVERFYNTIEKKRIRRKVVKTFVTISGIAALIIITLFIPFKQEKFVKIPQTTSFAAEQKITKPTLILSTGEMVELDNTIYTKQLESISQVIDPIQFNKLVVPPKCKFRLELEDGSIVFLNADSELSYPISFAGKSRELILHRGEAYFEVVKNERPFKVIVDNAVVNVYGTKFNVSYYVPEKIETVLFEGSLGVALNNLNETIINPGELISINSISGDKKITTVNTRNFLTWVNGFVSCDENPLHFLLEQVSRWYNVEFLIEESVNTDIPIHAYFSIERPLSEILKSIEDITNIKFTKIDGGNYMVK